MFVIQCEELERKKYRLRKRKGDKKIKKGNKNDGNIVNIEKTKVQIKSNGTPSINKEHNKDAQFKLNV